jgi:hypothetical protein
LLATLILILELNGCNIVSSWGKKIKESEKLKVTIFRGFSSVRLIFSTIPSSLLILEVFSSIFSISYFNA